MPHNSPAARSFLPEGPPSPPLVASWLLPRRNSNDADWWRRIPSHTSSAFRCDRVTDHGRCSASGQQGRISRFARRRRILIGTLHRHAIRQPHLHTNANELSYIASGKARVGLIGPAGEKHLFDLVAGEVPFYEPAGWVHWLENSGDESMFALFMYSHEQPETIDIPDVLPGLPSQGY